MKWHKTRDRFGRTCWIPREGDRLGLVRSVTESIWHCIRYDRQPNVVSNHKTDDDAKKAYEAL